VIRPTSKTLVVAAILVGVTTAGGSALAQDFSVGREPTLTTSRLGIESSYANFDLDGTQGQYAGLTVRGDLKLAKHVGLRLLVPTYFIQLENLPTHFGPGDAAIRVRALLYEGHPWRFYWGVEDQLPTGDTSLHLGQGGTQLTPFITGGWRKGSFVAFLSVADCIGLHPNKVIPDDFVDPSTDHELRTVLGGFTEITDSFYVNVAFTDVTLLEPGQLGQTLLTGGIAFGYAFDDDAKIVLIDQMPVAGDHRFEEKIGLNGYFYF
jgi:hypothetical protein